MSGGWGKRGRVRRVLWPAKTRTRKEPRGQAARTHMPKETSAYSNDCASQKNGCRTSQTIETASRRAHKIYLLPWPAAGENYMIGYVGYISKKLPTIFIPRPSALYPLTLASPNPRSPLTLSAKFLHVIKRRVHRLEHLTETFAEVEALGHDFLVQLSALGVAHADIVDHVVIAVLLRFESTGAREHGWGRSASCSAIMRDHRRACPALPVEPEKGAETQQRPPRSRDSTTSTCTSTCTSTAPAHAHNIDHPTSTHDLCNSSIKVGQKDILCICVFKVGHYDK